MDDVQTDAPVIDIEAAVTVSGPETDWEAVARSAEAKLAEVIDERDAAKLRVETAENEIAVLTAERDALQAVADKAAKAPKVSRAIAGAKPRKVGPLDNPGGSDLLDAIAAAETVEVVFSDGKFELLQIPALVVSGVAWAKVIGGVALRVPELTLHGPAMGQNPWPLAGYGLFLDGKQAAWAPRPDTLMIGGGMQVNLRDDVIFPAE
jgi:hypothetical protein